MGFCKTRVGLVLVVCLSVALAVDVTFDSMDSSNDTVSMLEARISKLEKQISGLKVRRLVCGPKDVWRLGFTEFLASRCFRSTGEEAASGQDDTADQRHWDDTDSIVLPRSWILFFLLFLFFPLSCR